MFFTSQWKHIGNLTGEESACAWKSVHNQYFNPYLYLNVHNMYIEGLLSVSLRQALSDYRTWIEYAHRSHGSLTNNYKLLKAVCFFLWLFKQQKGEDQRREGNESFLMLVKNV